MGGTLAVDGAGVVAVILLVVLAGVIGIAGRRVLLDRGGGTVECGLRRPAGDGSWPRWRLGVARYRRDELCWHQIFGVRLRPDETLARSGLTVVSRRRPVSSEIGSLGGDAVIVQCQPGAGDQAAGPVELAMGEAAMTGFLAWLEAAPRRPYRRGLPPAARIARLASGPVARPPGRPASRTRQDAVSARPPASTARRRDPRSPAGPG